MGKKTQQKHFLEDFLSSKKGFFYLSITEMDPAGKSLSTQNILSIAKGVSVIAVWRFDLHVCLF